MKKTELLCPAGNFEMLKIAIHSGADAIYLSGEKYGARKFANNFNNEEIVEAIKYAHLYGVKIYITINTLIKDYEVDDFIDFVDFIHKNNVDAVLMQDLGMINLVKKTFPNLEIHASTQFHNHNNGGLKFLKEIGIKRAVLARELSIDEIKKLDVDIEKEVFVHGALCISYSGECLMSSIIMNRSGNRGECAGMCRLPYNLYEDNKCIKTDGNYLLSTKELCTIENIHELLALKIDSIKIEGRMKSPEYVGYITKLYRKAIDSYYNNKEIIITNKEIEELKVLFNREFTKGYLFNEIKIVNQNTPNHQGIEIGKIIEIKKNKLKVKLSKNLNQGDAIRFKNSNKGTYINFMYDTKGKLINKASKGEIILLDNKCEIKELDTILKTIDINLLNKINNYPLKKIPINIKIEALLNKPLKIEFNDETNFVYKEGNIIENAIKNETTQEEIIEKISKLGDTIYIINNIEINKDNNIFIPISEINKIRRELVKELNDKRLTRKNQYIKNKPIFYKNNLETTNEISVLIDNENDYKILNQNNITFYTENIILYKKYKENNNIYLKTPRIIKDSYKYENDKVLTNDIGIIYNNKTNTIISDIYSNVTNIYTLEYLHELGVKKIGISPELTKEEVYDLYNNFINKFKYIPNIEVFTYGYIELMLLKHCILKENINKNTSCITCNNNKKYYLEDRNKEYYKITPTKCGNIIKNCKLTNNLENINKIKGINLYISLIDIEDKTNIINYIKTNY